MLSFLEVSDGFIQLAQQQHNPDFEQWTTLPNNVQLRALDAGIVEVKPQKDEKACSQIVISCGIHGNETAPIEIVSDLISKIVTGVVHPKNNLLFILGNPESMKLGERFVSINLNRLFAGAHSNYEQTSANRYELERAQRLESAVSRFFESGSADSRIHLDLHTAIKASYHRTFAIRPFQQRRIHADEKRMLSAMGIEAVLQYNKPSTTFSYFSCHTFNALAYTLELGKVRPFGENNSKDFSRIISSLRDLVKAISLKSDNPDQLIEYKVVAEIVKHSDDFKFYVSDSVKNFTGFPQGTLIAEDFDYNYRVAFEEESVVFPNINVPTGQRVAVMVTRRLND